MVNSTYILLFLAGACFYCAFQLFGRPWATTYWAILIIFNLIFAIYHQSIIVLLLVLIALPFLWRKFNN